MAPGILEWITDFFVKPLTAAITGLVEAFGKGIKTDVPDPFAAGSERFAIGRGIPEGSMMTGGSPLTSDEAFKQGWELVKDAEDRVNNGMSWSVGFEAASFGQIDVTLGFLMAHPTVRVDMNVAQTVRGMEFDVGITPFLRRYWLKQYLPFVPPIQDLRLMAIREAFDVEPGEPQFKEMEKWAVELGMDPFWTERYRLAGFERMGLDQAYYNLYRGFWTEEDFKAFLRIADIHPDDRDPIARVAYRPLGVRTLRHGWETGVLDDDKIVANYRMMGRSPEDAVIAAEALKEYALHEERMGVLTEWRYDFEEGLITEETLRANMESIKIIGVRQDYYVERSRIRRERQQARDLLEIYEDAYAKDLLTDEELERQVGDILVDSDAARLFLDKAYVQKYKKPKAD